MPTPPWFDYRVKEDGLTPNCEEFTLVSHVTHIDNALAVVRCNLVRPQLVYDDSKLLKRRILVVWLSPNYWHNGFRYGNISFDYDFPQLVERRRAYWVEAIKHTPNSPTACRILITNVDRDGDKHMIRYDPCAKDGPWWWDRRRGKHFRNSRVTLEFMFESELQVGDCHEVDFVAHHEHQCCIDPTACPELGYTPERGGALFVAGIIAEKLSATDLGMSNRVSEKEWDERNHARRRS